MQGIVFGAVSASDFVARRKAKRLAGRFSSPSFILSWIISISSSPLAIGAVPGTFAPTGNMMVQRAEHSATLLLNGKVLIAGGYYAAPGYMLASAELYDPYAGTFRPTGNMTTPRVGHTATLLPDGRVLIAGGNGANSAELYDPATGTFMATGSMIASTRTQTATLLGNGKVLIAGGASNAELYDPGTGTFALTGAYAGSHAGELYVSTATSLPGGRVLITGCDCSSNASPLIQLYDPGTGTFSNTGTMSGTENWWWENVNTGTLLMNGKVLVAGSGELNWIPADAEVYDPSTGIVTAIGKTIAPHEFSTATLLADGTVLIAGGQIPGGNGIRDADLYVPATGMFYAAVGMAVGRHLHTATLLRDGTVLIAGGFSIWSSGTASAEIYRPGITPTVQILDNDTGSTTKLAAGDSFSFLVTGAPPSSEVFVSETGWAAPLGYTDLNGSFRLSGTVGFNVVGVWQQTWTIGGVAAQPSPLQFTITPKH